MWMCLSSYTVERALMQDRVVVDAGQAIDIDMLLLLFRLTEQMVWLLMWPCRRAQGTLLEVTCVIESMTSLVHEPGIGVALVGLHI
jgi:hypothetical protein